MIFRVVKRNYNQRSEKNGTNRELNRYKYIGQHPNAEKASKGFPILLKAVLSLKFIISRCLPNSLQRLTPNLENLTPFFYNTTEKIIMS